MANFVNIRHDPNTDPFALAGQALAPGAQAFGQGLVQPLQDRRINDDVAGIKQWVDGGMVGAPPSANTPFGQELTGTLVLRQANEQIADPGGKTLRKTRRNISREGRLTEARTAETLARTDVLSTGSGKGFTATNLGLQMPLIRGAIDAVKNPNFLGIGVPFSKGRKQKSFLKSFTDSVINNPTTDWPNLSRTQQVQLWNLYKGTLAKEEAEQGAGGEIAFDLGSRGVRDFEEKLFGRGTTTQAEDGTVQIQGEPETTVSEISAFPDFTAEGVAPQEMTSLVAGLNDESRESFKAVEARWKEALRQGNREDAEHWEKWLNLMVQAVRPGEAGPPDTRSFRGDGATGSRPLPRQFPNNTAGVPLSRRSSRSPADLTRADQLPVLRGTRQ